MTDPDPGHDEIASMNAPALAVAVTWTPHDGSPRTVVGDYLTRWGDEIALACGIETLLDDLGLPQLTPAHEIAVAELVNAQLREGGAATIRCPGGTARLTITA